LDGYPWAKEPQEKVRLAINRHNGRKNELDIFIVIFLTEFIKRADLVGKE